jgi:hypothetical protein
MFGAGGAFEFSFPDFLPVHFHNDDTFLAGAGDGGLDDDRVFSGGQGLRAAGLILLDDCTD